MKRTLLFVSLISLVSLVGGASCAAKRKPASYVVTGTAGYGAAYGPSGVAAGATTGFKIRDRNGVITRNLLVALVAAGNARIEQGEGSVRVNYHESCSETMCTTYKTYERVPGEYKAAAPTEQEVANVKQFIEDLDATDVVPIETTIDVALDALGGDTNGLIVSMEMRSAGRSLGPFDLVTFGYGLSAGQMKFRGRTQRFLGRGAGANELQVSEGAVDYNYNVFAFPLRLDMYIGAASIYARVDLNTFTLLEQFTGERESPSPWNVGAVYRLGPLFTSAQLTFVEMQASAMTVSAEVGFAF